MYVYVLSIPFYPCEISMRSVLEPSMPDSAVASLSFWPDFFPSAAFWLGPGYRGFLVTLPPRIHSPEASSPLASAGSIRAWEKNLILRTFLSRVSFFYFCFGSGPCMHILNLSVSRIDTIWEASLKRKTGRLAALPARLGIGQEIDRVSVGGIGRAQSIPGFSSNRPCPAFPILRESGSDLVSCLTMWFQPLISSPPTFFFFCILNWLVTDSYRS